MYHRSLFTIYACCFKIYNDFVSKKESTTGRCCIRFTTRNKCWRWFSWSCIIDVPRMRALNLKSETEGTTELSFVTKCRSNVREYASTLLVKNDNNKKLVRVPQTIPASTNITPSEQVGVTRLSPALPKTRWTSDRRMSTKLAQYRRKTHSSSVVTTRSLTALTAETVAKSEFWNSIQRPSWQRWKLVRVGSWYEYEAGTSWKLVRVGSLERKDWLAISTTTVADRKNTISDPKTYNNTMVCM